jgi:hypothetical protein
MNSISRVRFQPSDAWLLTSIAIGDHGRGAGLRDVIAVGDYINHAIFTAREIREGVFRLAAAGYVVIAQGKMKIRGKAKRRWREISKSRRAVLRQLDEMESFLEIDRNRPIDPAGPDGAVRDDGISDEAVKAAYEEYLRDSGVSKT